MKLTCVALCLAACANAKDFKLIFENTGSISGFSLYWTGVKEGNGNQVPDSLGGIEQGGLEAFQSFLEVGDKAGHMARFGSRFVIRGKDTTSGPGFRAAVQIQKGHEKDGSEFPYTFVVTAIGHEDKAKATVEIVHRGQGGADSKAYRWVEPGHTVGQLTHGSAFNAFELRDAKNSPVVKITLFDASDEL